MSLKAFKILYGIYNDYSEFKKSKENPNEKIEIKYLFNGKIFDSQKKYFYAVVRHYQKKNPKIVKRLKEFSNDKERIFLIRREIQEKHPLWYYAILNFNKIKRGNE